MGPQKIRKFGRKTSILGVLGLDLHFNSSEPVHFFGAQSSLGGAQAVIWGGGTAPECPPWRRACRSQQKISRYYNLTQDFLNLSINQFYKKLTNFIPESFFFSERERIHFDPNLFLLILYFSRVLIRKLKRVLVLHNG